jgi:hypothetical protein
MAYPGVAGAALEAELKRQAAAQQVCGQAVGMNQANCCDTKAVIGEEMPIHGLYRLRANAEHNHAKLSRVIDILERHPEFQEFLEVLRSGLV